MKILCQERYEKAVAYAKEIKNDTLQKCIDRLKQWEENPNCPCEIELYYDSAPHSFGFPVFRTQQSTPTQRYVRR